MLVEFVARRFALPFCLVLVVVFTLAWSPAPGMGYDLIAQDLDYDEDVDHQDLTLFQGCLSGGDVEHDGSSTCAYADTDQDGDVDMDDFNIMQQNFTGPGA